jgi:hypothetical protein
VVQCFVRCILEMVVLVSAKPWRQQSSDGKSAILVTLFFLSSCSPITLGLPSFLLSHHSCSPTTLALLSFLFPITLALPPLLLSHHSCSPKLGSLVGLRLREWDGLIRVHWSQLFWPCSEEIDAEFPSLQEIRKYNSLLVRFHRSQGCRI